MEKLDNFVLNIEFLLISVVQGVALGALATASVQPMGTLQIQTFPYILTGFLIILTYWSGAIIHALSFIDWPLNLWHSFLYFLTALIEVVAFYWLVNPLLWFGFTALFFLMIEVLYILDLRIIRDHQKKLNTTDKQKKLYQHILSQQLFEMKYLVPAGCIFSLICLIFIYNYPLFFLNQGYHVLLGFIQAIFVFIFLLTSMSSFKKRSSLIAENI